MVADGHRADESSELSPGVIKWLREAAYLCLHDTSIPADRVAARAQAGGSVPMSSPASFETPSRSSRATTSLAAAPGGFPTCRGHPVVAAR